MAKDSLTDDIIGLVKFAGFHLPFWALPLISIAGGVLVYIGVSALLSPILEYAPASARALPVYAGGAAFLIIFIAAGFGWVERLNRKSIYSQTNSLEELRGLTWRDFELLISELYRKAGYSVTEGPGNAPDGGIDLDLRSPSGERVLVQCKHWKGQKIGVSVVREMLGVLTREKADLVTIVGTGYFTKEALKWAKNQPIELVDGPKLLKLIERFSGGSKSESQVVPPPADSVNEETNNTICPRCGNDLVQRIARQGKHAGSKFYGCSQYPKCRYTHSI